MTLSLWLEEPTAPIEPSRDDGPVDVAVVGAGVTGCACALALAEGGLRVRVYEARTVAGGASGRNGGFALRGGAPAYDRARAELGVERAQALWQLTERTLDRLESLAGDAFQRTGSLRLAATAEERADLEAEYEALRMDGFAVEWREDLEPPLARFHGGIWHPDDGAIQPARWVRRLAARALAAGAQIREGIRVSSIGDLPAEQVVVALDGFTSGLLPELDRVVWPTRGQVIATAPLGRRVFEHPLYAREGYDYWQQTPEGRLVLGGFRDMSEETEFTADEAITPVIQQHLEEFAAELLGGPVPITHRWAGVFGMTADRYPLAGSLLDRAGAWIAGGYSGHGNVLGLACGSLVAGAILGHVEPELELFDPARVLR